MIALLWTTEALPLEVTSLLPVVILPMMGLMKTGDVAREYFTGANMLLLAAMGVAAAAQVRFSTTNIIGWQTPTMQFNINYIQLMTVHRFSIAQL